MVIPDQWRFAKIVPVHKKGSKQMIENYRPVSNLGSTYYNQILTSRQTKFKSRKTNNLKVGLYALSNRFYVLNDQIPLNLLGGGYEIFKSLVIII